MRVLGALKWLCLVIVGILGWMMQTPPEVAESNATRWLDNLGLSSLGEGLTTTTDTLITAGCGVIGVIIIILIIRPWLGKKMLFSKPQVFPGDAKPITFHNTIHPATGTAYKPSVWMRLRSFVTLRKRLKGVPVLQRCLDELIAYSGYAFPGEVTQREIAASNALSVHLERACFVLDEQGISHPEFDDRDIVIANYNEWRRFLTKLLARNDAQ